jgi:hypothetical protein
LLGRRKDIRGETTTGFFLTGRILYTKIDRTLLHDQGKSSISLRFFMAHSSVFQILKREVSVDAAHPLTGETMR